MRSAGHRRFSAQYSEERGKTDAKTKKGESTIEGGALICCGGPQADELPASGARGAVAAGVSEVGEPGDAGTAVCGPAGTSATATAATATAAH
jgi:hypothetical protein